MTDSQGIYQQGTAVTLDAQFLVDTTPTDPTTVTFNVRAPDDTLVSYVFGVDANVTNPGVGHYVCKLDPPALPRQYYYDAVGTGAVEATLPGEFYIVPSSVIPPPASVGPQLPPCTTWIDGEDLAQCAAAGDTDPGVLDGIAVMASMLMFELSGRQFNGICGPATVRPCKKGCGAGLQSWGTPWWSWGYWSGDWGYGWFWGNEDGGRLCSCGYDSKVELAGYPVTEIVEVKIDGQVLPATFTDGSPQYRLDEWRFLTRLSDPASPDFPLHFPSCQRLDLQDDQPGTWSVKYLYGVPPPPLGIEAAKQIGCQLLNAVSGKPCALPSNATKLVKQGTTIERVTPLATILRSGGTGLVMVNSFLAAVNPSGLKRRPSVFSPDAPFPVRTGAQ